jgi:hypothetical protein
MSWQRDTRRARFGLDWEHNRGGQLTWADQPATPTLFSPGQERAYNQTTTPDQQIALPAAFNSLNDIPARARITVLLSRVGARANPYLPPELPADLVPNFNG